jgi:hypothetical protein
MEELGQGRVDVGSELTGCQLIYLFYRERSDPERGQNALAGQLRYRPLQSRIVSGLAFSIRTEDQESSGWLMAGSTAEQVKRGRVGPVQVVQDQNQRCPSGNRRQEICHCLEEAQPCLLHRQRVAGGPLAQTPGQLREDARQRGSVRTHLLTQQVELDGPDVPSKGFEKGQIGRYAFCL